MGKAQFPSQLSWQTTSPVTGFLPGPGPGQDVAGNSYKSGVTTATLDASTTFYTNITGMRQSDNVGVELVWTGTPSGTVSVMCSNSGVNFFALTFNPILAQPSGSDGGYLINMTGLPFQYMFLQYVPSDGSGTMKAYLQCKANNS